MGLNSGVKATYITIKDASKEKKEGKYRFFRTDDKELTEPFTSFTGTITGMNFRDFDWNGKTISSFNIYFTDEDENFVISVGADSGFTKSFLCVAPNIAPDLPVRLYATRTDYTAKDNSVKHNYYLNASQPTGENGKYEAVKKFYSQGKEGDRILPPINWVVLGKKNVADSSEQDDFLREVAKNVDSFINGKDFDFPIFEGVKQDPPPVTNAPVSRATPPGARAQTKSTTPPAKTHMVGGKPFTPVNLREEKHEETHDVDDLPF